jgi:phage virion morphogenesis protein
VKWPALQVGSLLSWSYGFKKGGTHRTKKGGPTKAGRAALAGRKILTRDSYLRNSVAPLNITANSILIGTNMDYAAIHQFGGKAGRDKKVSIPARPYLMFQDEDVNYLEMTLVNYVLTGRI